MEDIASIVRSVTKEEVIASYKALQEAPCVKKIHFGRSGIKTLDHYFFKHRMKAKTKGGLSFADAIASPERVAFLSDLVRRYKKVDPATLSRSDLLKKQYDVFQLYYGTVNQFRPIVAKWVYCKLKPTVGILDFSAGWGGRCLAAMSIGVPYIGIDANVNLQSAYKSMIREVDPSAKVQLMFKPSETVDFSKYKYDLIFTSPPYFMLEKYEKMPEYKTKQEFLERFFIPVVKKAWRSLQRKGHMALNMPKEMYEAVKPYLPRLYTTYELPLINRNPASAALQKDLKNAPRSELIYVWRKIPVPTRKQKKSHRRQTKKNPK